MRKYNPQVWATSFSHLVKLSETDKNLNMKAMITHKRIIYHRWAKTNKAQALCLEQDKEAN